MASPPRSENLELQLMSLTYPIIVFSTRVNQSFLLQIYLFLCIYM